MAIGTEDAAPLGLQHGKVTEAVIGCAFEVINELGAGFLESVYEKALAIALRDQGLLGPVPVSNRRSISKPCRRRILR